MSGYDPIMEELKRRIEPRCHYRSGYCDGPVNLYKAMGGPLHLCQQHADWAEATPVEALERFNESVKETTAQQERWQDALAKLVEDVKHGL